MLRVRALDLLVPAAVLIACFGNVALAGNCLPDIDVCCTQDNCPAMYSPDGCACDECCDRFGDCCDDIDSVCPKEPCVHGDVRLVGGSTDLEGRVEVCFNGTWGTVCDDNWNSANARVVCQQLGHPNEGAQAFPGGQFGPELCLPIHLDDVSCLGNESSLLECSYSELNDCNHGEDAGVECGEPQCVDGDIRLADGTSDSNGRVEVCRNNIWGTVCDNGWDTLDATVVCRQLGIEGTRVLPTAKASFGAGTGAINLDDVQCTGSEASLLDCPFVGNSECTHDEDAGVFCGVELGCIDGEVRLQDGTNFTNGRVEVCLDRHWGTVCNDSFDEFAAKVVCRDIGYPSGGAVVIGSENVISASPEVPVHLTGLSCTGHETDLLACQHSFATENCSHVQDVGVQCLPGPGECNDGEVRLMDGTSDQDGRLEVCVFQRWGSVCDVNFGTKEAKVVCRQLGASTDGALALHGAFFGPFFGPINLADVQCTADEEFLLNCSFTSNHDCFHSNDVSVRCPCFHGDVRLVDGDNNRSGRVELCLNGVWGTVADQQWTTMDAQVVCAQLGFVPNLARPLPEAAFGLGDGLIILNNPNCQGDEDGLIECPGSFFSDNTHADDVGVVCFDTIESTVCDNGELRIIDGNGRIEVCFDDTWGTVCSDFWGNPDAAVACSELGFANIGTATRNLRPPYASRAVPIYMDDVGCGGTEEKLAQCNYDGATEDCVHRPNFFNAGDAGVICYEQGNCTHGEIRLADGSTDTEGRVELCWNGVWGTVESDFFWTVNDARVVCRQLAHFEFLGIPTSGATFGPGEGPIVMTSVFCTGEEEFLVNCTAGLDTTGASHVDDAGVVCFPTEAPPNATCGTGDVRLVGGSTELEGRVELCIGGQWGTICGALWSAEDASVVCNQLNFSAGGALSRTDGYFGAGEGPIYLSNIICDGGEVHLLDCFFTGPPPFCTHQDDVGVICQPRMCDEADVRIVDGPDESEGRVEVCVGGQWGTVCDDFWGTQSALVVCRQLGYYDQYALAYNLAFHGSGDELPIVLDDVFCEGTENNLLECPHTTSHNCIHVEDAGVKCYEPEVFAPGAGECNHGEVRLVGGAVDNEGRVEVCIAGYWGTVCDDRFAQIDALVICRSLNYSDVGAVAIPNAEFGEGLDLDIFMDNVLCFGEEESLVDCLFDPHTEDCTHGDDVAVRCFVPGNCTDGDVRLVNGSRPSEGRVELCLSGIWGTVADDGWDKNSARVVCSQLGYSSQYVIDYHNSFYGEGEGAVHIEEVSCQGDEATLLNCTFITESTLELHFDDAGVRCFNVTDDVCTPGSVRLVNSTDITEGRLEVCLDDVWGTVCDDLFDYNSVRVVCGQLGFSSEVGLRLPPDAFSPANDSVPIFLDNVQCLGTETDLLQCDLDSHVADCIHEEDVNIRCYVPEDCPEGSVRLVDGIQGEFEGRVEMCLHGVWGSVCNDEWDNEDSRVVCRELGYSDLFVVTHLNPIFGEGTGPFQISETLCTGNEDRLLGCVYNTDVTGCTHTFSESGVSCYNESQCDPGDVRLQGGNITVEGSGGSYLVEGRVEVCADGLWATVCDTNWDLPEATVVCRQLGLPTEFAVAYTGAFYGEGTGEIAFDQVRCSGTEQSISDCFTLSNPPFVGPCQHNDDASVACYPERQCDEWDIRLVDGEAESEGRLEVCLYGVWGSVASSFTWGNDEAAVVCRQLGYLDTVVEAEPFALLFGPGSGPIHLSTLSCVGNESSVEECDNDTNIAFSSHFLDVGVRCYQSGDCEVGSVFLVNGEVPGEGRVEVCVDGVVGTVADDGWDENDAKVVCRQLGYTDIVAFAFSNAEHGPGEGPIALDNVDCLGNETNILECDYTNALFDFHFEDAGVRCFNETSEDGNCTTGDIQLEGGEDDAEGRLEICLDGVWGVVCHNGWNPLSASVVCKELGYAALGNSPYYASFFGPDEDDPIWLSSVFCSGEEERLIDCQLTLGPGTCTHKQEAGVQCLPLNCTDGEVRLVGGETDYEGTVEICIGGQWGTVCDDSWGNDDARVVCRQLGYPDNFAASFDNAFFGLGTGPIAITNVDCTGTEDALINCTFNHENFNCFHSEDAGVRCFPDVPGGECTEGAVRLVDGPNEMEGRVEVCVSGEWGSVCNDLWNVDDALVVCRQLEFAEIGTALLSAFPSLNTSTHLDDVMCSGDEEVLTQCNFDFITTDCLSDEDAGVRCYVSDNCTHGDLRLVDGIGVYEGRLEICFNGVWSTISDDLFTANDAAVACAQLGFIGPGSQVVPGAQYGSGTGPIALDVVTCFGFEENLLDCFFDDDSTEDTHAEDVGVNCSVVCYDNEIRVVDGNTPTEGRVEICFDQVWGTITDDFWSFLDAVVACRQLGFSDQYATPRPGGYFLSATEDTPIYLDNVQCSGTETRLADCVHSRMTEEDVHDEDAGVTCFIPDGCTHGDIRLIGDNVFFNDEGRVEVCVDGFWGTISGDSWDTFDAKVACRQLGFSDLYATPFSGDELGTNPSIPIVIGASLCFGDEEALVNCTYIPVTAFEDPNNVAGVQCYLENVIGLCQLGDVRLRGGDNPDTEGRVEVCIDRQYGTICDDALWNSVDTSVVCRQLGLSATGAMTASFGPGSGDIRLDNVVCDGTESNILECPHSAVVSSDCTHLDDAGVICQTGDDCDEGDIRLVGGNVDYEGRVEVCVNGVWGTVCHDLWSTEDARVACRQLNLPTGYPVAFPEAVFGEGIVPILIDDIECTGTEDSLLNCSYDFTTTDCSHSDDAGVACLATRQCNDGDIRLQNGTTATEGRVEVCQFGVWGTVCDDHWGVEDARVACTNLGMPTDYAVPYNDGYFGSGVGPIYIADIRCLGSEGQLLDCPFTSEISIQCDHSEDSGVACLTQPQCTPDGDIRLVGGPDDSAGRVELCLHGIWGTISNDLWSSADALVVCTQLGFSDHGAVAVTDSGVFGPGNGPIHFDNVVCTGAEVELLDCVHSRVAYEDAHEKDAGVRCFAGGQCESNTLRINGESDNEGRVEVCIDGVWGLVSSTGWNTADAKVVCRQLGYHDAVAAATREQDLHDLPLLIDNVICTGNESTLFDCTLDTVGLFDFQLFDAGVACFDGSDNRTCNLGDIRVVDGDTDFSGRLEVCIGNDWGTVCNLAGFWGEEEANVACSQLGYASVGATPTSEGTPNANFRDPILIRDVACFGNEETIFDCAFSVTTTRFCTHTRDVFLTCLPYDCEPGDVRVVDGPSESEGRVEVCLGGAWGTVCDDLWNVNDARVVCGQIGYNSLYAEAPGFSEYGEATGPIHLDNVICSGSEPNLLACAYTTPAVPPCTHENDAGVKCFNESVGDCVTGDVRLVGNGNTSFEGTVEVCILGQWGTVCDQVWGYREAMVVCQQLGFDQSAFAYKHAYYGTTNDNILLDYVLCLGIESSLLECSYDTKTIGCTQAEDAGVRCLPGDECTHGEVRLIGGQSEAEGTVEVCIEGLWGTISDNLWSTADARVICRQLGSYSTEVAVGFGQATFGPGFGVIHLDNVRCRGDEVNILDCPGSRETSEDFHSGDAGVRCYLPGSGDTCITGEVQLVDGETDNEGRVEVCFGGIWGTVSDNTWNYNDVVVLCQQLGFSPIGALPLYSAFFGAGDGPIFASSVVCLGNEDSILHCTFSPDVDAQTHANDAGARCFPRDNCTNGDVRLRDGRVEYEGRVEVCVNETWGTINNDRWNHPDGIVVCRQLGYNDNTAETTGLQFPPGSGPIAMDFVQCIGIESNLLECLFSPDASEDSHENDAGVKCVPLVTTGPPTTQPPSERPTTPKPARADENTVTVVFEGTSTEFNSATQQDKVRSATANAVNAYCEDDPDECEPLTRRKRNHIQIEDADVVIVSINDADEGAEVVMYVVLDGGSGVLDDDALARAVSEGTEYYTQEGLTVVSATQTNRGGLSGGQQAGIAIAVVILIAIIILVMVIVVLGIYWFYRKSPTAKPSMLLFRSSGSFSNPIVEPESGFEMDVKTDEEDTEVKKDLGDDTEMKKDLAEAEANEYTLEPEKTFST